MVGIVASVWMLGNRLGRRPGQKVSYMVWLEAEQLRVLGTTLVEEIPHPLVSDCGVRVVGITGSTARSAGDELK